MIESKKARTTLTLNRLTMMVLILGVFALIELTISNRIANDTKGSAYMVNQLGLLRMKNYQILTLIPLTPEEYSQLDIFSEQLFSSQYLKLLQRYDLLQQFEQLKSQWVSELEPKIKSATSLSSIRQDVALYVLQIDQLVSNIDQKTEDQLIFISRLQQLSIGIIILLLGLQIYYLRRYIFAPWHRLLIMADSISKHDFTPRFKVKNSRNEFDLLGEAFNNMSQEIQSQYLFLEQRVKKKTLALQHKNEVLSFLYQSAKRLHTPQPLCERFLLILTELESLVPLGNFKIRFYEFDDTEHYQQISHNNKRLSSCQNQYCNACLTKSHFTAENVINRSWYLQDNDEKYGLLIAQQSVDTKLTKEQEQLISALIEQMTMALLLERQMEKQKQYLVIQERAAMARELHDSIAQSLSCLKMQLACLKMQPDINHFQSLSLLQDMRKELNTAYSQLRELITSFQIKLNHTGFYLSLAELIDEFNQKLNLEIKLDYKLPPNIINVQYGIHLLQIIRESLNNIYKHAQATQVEITLLLKDDGIISLTITDNGVGFDKDLQKQESYGLVIMRDRADLINGYIDIESEVNKGVKISIMFKVKKE